MGKSRLEAFSDGVIAIIITIMVLELRAPHGADLETLAPLLPAFLSYVLSFVYVGIYWNNHHHLLHALEHGATGAVLWANLHLLFWLSLFPFATAWMGENEFAPIALRGLRPRAADGRDCVPAARARDDRGRRPELRAAACDRQGLEGEAVAALLRRRDRVDVLVAMGCQALYVLVALLWLIPDRRIERALKHGAHS